MSCAGPDLTGGARAMISCAGAGRATNGHSGLQTATMAIRNASVRCTSSASDGERQKRTVSSSVETVQEVKGKRRRGHSHPFARRSRYDGFALSTGGESEATPV